MQRFVLSPLETISCRLPALCLLLRIVLLVLPFGPLLYPWAFSEHVCAWYRVLGVVKL